MDRWDGQIDIMEIPLKDKTLKITNTSIQVENPKEILFIMQIQNVLAITPRETGICIYYARGESHPFRPHREIYELDKSQPAPFQVCRKILEKLASVGLVQKNDKGLLYIKSDEEILRVFPNVRIHGNVGSLYITSLGIIHETSVGISMYMRYFQMVHVRKLESIIEIKWEYMVSSMKDPIFSFKITMPSNSDSKDAYLQITRQIAGTDSVNDKFDKWDRDFSMLEPEKIYDLVRNNDKDFDEYLFVLTLLAYGYYSYYFTDYEKELIIACRLLKFDEKLVNIITDKEVEQRNFSSRYRNISEHIIKEFNLDKEDLEDYVEDCLKSNQHPDQTQQDIQGRYSEMMDSLRFVNKMEAESLRYYDKRVMILYKKWCEDNPLQNFDEYNDEWINYILKKSDNQKIHNPLDDNCISYKELEIALKIRNQNRYTLTNFVAPSHIERKDIYNNCWYDKQHEMWYVQDDNLHHTLQNIADSDPDRSETVIGRRVWGFKKDRVEMFCGFPSIVHKSIYEEGPIVIVTSRSTGQGMQRFISGDANYILPILRDSDIMPEMEIRYGSMYYKAYEIKYTINPSGDYLNDTPKMTKLIASRYGFADIPLNERVRRALFGLETGLRFNPQAPLGPYKIEIPETYPNALFDERFEVNTP